MSEEKLYLRHVMLYEFRKGVTARTAVENIQDVYQDRAPAIRNVRKWFAKFRRGDLHLDDQPLLPVGQTINSDKMAKSEITLLQELTIKQGFSPVYNFKKKRTIEIKQFVCKVSCKEFKTRGTGPSKKKAKQYAARNMLSLLATIEQISLPAGFSSLVKNAIQSLANSPVKTYETSPSSIQSTTDYNYIGLLQILCQQVKKSVSNILYKIVREEGPPHKKYFTIEVSVGSSRETATARSKKAAKQEAARKFLLQLKSVNLNIANQNIASPSNTTDPINIAGPNVANPNVPLDANKVAVNNMNTLENNLRKLGIEISESAAKKEDKRAKQDTKLISNIHTLFERNYSSKISYSMREKMRIIRDKYDDHIDLMGEIRRDIERALGVTIEQVAVRGSTTNCVVCLRLLSYPRIAQFGYGETTVIAQRRAMSNLMAAILTFLNV